MKKVPFIWAFAVPLALALTSCSSQNATEKEPAGGGDGPAPTAEAPAKLTTAKTLDVQVFKGGYDDDFYRTAAEEYGKKAGVQITVTGDPRIWEKLTPRFNAGDAPDLAFPGWNFDHWKLVSEGQVMPLDAELDKMSDDGKTKWRDTFEPSMLRLCQLKGKTYILPFYYSVLGWWYKPDLFAANGWTAPKNYDELLALCEKMKAKGIAPITYQGKYPDYMISGMLTPWIISIGGMDAFNKIQNLEKGAWLDPSVVEAAKRIKTLKDKGYFQDGAASMTHTESQTQFVNSKAGMIPCGTWLYAEMEKTMPKGTQMSFFLPPVIAGGKGDPSSIMIKIEPWLVPLKSKNQEHAIGYYKYMTSVPKATQFVKEKGTLMAIKGSTPPDLPSYLKGASDDFLASKAAYAPLWREWYQPLYKAVEGNVTSLVTGDLSPEDFAKKCEEAAEKLRNDPDVIKFKL